MSASLQLKATRPKASGVRKRVKLSDPETETPQRARKRELDRLAQRTFREKTKSRILYLERTVETYKAENQSQLVAQLLEHNAALYGTIERLRKILNDAFTSSLTEIAKSQTKDQTDSNSEVKRRASYPQIPAVFKTAPVENLPQKSTSAEWKDIAGDNLSSASLRPDPSYSWETQHASIRSPHSSPQDDVEAGCIEVDTMTNEYAGIMIPTVTPTAPVRSVHQCDDIFIDTQGIPDRNYDLFGCQQIVDETLITQDMSMICESLFPRCPPKQIPIAFATDFELYDLWHATNSVYSRIYQYTPVEAAAARDADSGCIFRAIKHGWDMLSAADQGNPVNQILREYDALVCHKLDKVHRVAIAYKNYQLIKYYLNLDNEDLERMPYWQRPRPSQRSKKHPILIDFFAWPGVRERFINGDLTIYCKKFAVAYMKYFHFVWPFSFENTYEYCPSTDCYRASPLFDRRHRDLRSWSMEQKFFLEFPELAEDISSPTSWDVNASALFPPSPRRDSWLSDMMPRPA